MTARSSWNLGAGYDTDAHLPGAINIPPGHVDGLAPTLLPDLLVRRDDTGPGYPLQSLHDTHGGYMMIG